jgi:hypothetical protein
MQFPASGVENLKIKNDELQRKIDNKLKLK